jgi:hypothetical protein
LGAALAARVEKLYLAFAREVYALVAAPANNLQSLYSLYAASAGRHGLHLDSLHGFVTAYVAAVYRPTLASLAKTAASTTSARVQVGTVWTWYPLPFFGAVHAVAKEYVDSVVAQHQPGGVVLSEQCAR